MIEHALASLRRLGAAPIMADPGDDAGARIEREWLRTPWVVALSGGDVGEHVATLNHLAGEPLFTAALAPSQPIIVRRGSRTMLRVPRADGSTEERWLPTASAGGSLSDVASTRAQLAAREGVLERARRDAGLIAQRPPWWAVWAWIARWILALIHPARRAALITAAELVDESRRLVASEERRMTESAEAASGERRAFLTGLRELAAGGAAGRLVLEVADGPLPEGVDVIAVPPGASPPAEVDATLPPRALGPNGDGAHGLGLRLERARALRLARHACELLETGATALDRAVDEAERRFAARIERLELRRIAEPEAFAHAQLARLRPAVTQRVHSSIEQATVELGADLERITAQFGAVLEAATSTDALRAALVRIDQDAGAMLRAAREDAERLIAMGLGGGVHDLSPELCAELRLRSPGIELPRPPVPPAVEAITCLSKPLGLGSLSRLGSLFRSVDALKVELRAKFEERMASLRSAAVAELLGAQPAIESALASGLAAGLAQSLAHYAAALDRALADETAAIERQRADLAPLVAAREAVRADVRALARMCSNGADPTSSRAPEAIARPVL